MKRKQLKEWKSTLTAQQYKTLRIIWRISKVKAWARYRHMFSVCNSPRKRVSEMLELGVPIRSRKVKIRNEEGRLVTIKEMTV